MVRAAFWGVLLFIFSFLSAEEFDPRPPSCDVDGLPSAVHNGSVSVISGSYCDFEQDIVVEGPGGLSWDRSYNSHQHALSAMGLGWDHNHDMTFENYTLKGLGAELPTLSGNRYRYIGSSKRDRGMSKKEHFLVFSEKHNAQTNLGGNQISGRTNPRSTRIHYKKELEVSDSDGGSRVYEKIDSFYQGLYRPSNWNNKPFSKEIYQLLHRTSPAGIRTSYSWHDKTMPKKITVTDPTGESSWGELTLGMVDLEFKGSQVREIEASNGLKARYHFAYSDRSHPHYLLTHVQRPQAPDVIYRYQYDKEHKHHQPRIVRKEYPEGRYLATEYYWSGYYNTGVEGVVHVGNYKRDPRFNRVFRQRPSLLS